MRRRDFIAGFGGAVTLWPLAAAGANFREAADYGLIWGLPLRKSRLPWVGAFVKRLGELGWAEGRNVVIDYRWAEARSKHFKRDCGRVGEPQG